MPPKKAKNSQPKEDARIDDTPKKQSTATKKSKRTFFQYSSKALELAINEVRSGNRGVREAARDFQVPKTTLIDYLKGRTSKIKKKKTGPPPLLGEDVEEKIKTWIFNIAKCGFPINKQDLLDTVAKIVKDLKLTEKFPNGRPGQKWYSNFLKRNPDIAIRESECVSKARAIVTEEYIRFWFRDLRHFLNENDYEEIMQDPSRIFNADEAGFGLCPKKGKVLGPKGYKNLLSVNMGNEKENITVLIVITANGKIAPPLVIFPYVRPPKSIVESMPEKWVLGKSDSGWMRADVFYEYIVNEFALWLEENNIKRPVIFFMDGHRSHLTMALSEKCSELGIILYALPPNTTHLLQPADVSVFYPMKTYWKNTIRKWHKLPSNENKCVTKESFCPLFQSTLESNDMEQNIKNGFRKCGLFPLKEDAIDYTKCIKNVLESMTIAGNKTQDIFSKEELEVTQKVLNKLGKIPNLLDIDFKKIMDEIDRIKNPKEEINKEPTPVPLEIGTIISLNDAEIIPCEIVVQEEKLIDISPSIQQSISKSEIETNAEESFLKRHNKTIDDLLEIMDNDLHPLELPTNIFITDKKIQPEIVQTDIFSNATKIDLGMEEIDITKPQNDEEINLPSEKENMKSDSNMELEDTEADQRKINTNHILLNIESRMAFEIKEMEKQNKTSKIFETTTDLLLNNVEKALHGEDNKELCMTNKTNSIENTCNTQSDSKPIMSISDTENNIVHTPNDAEFSSKEKIQILSDISVKLPDENQDNNNKENLNISLDNFKQNAELDDISPPGHFERHLKYPKPLEKSKQKRERMPSAIASAKWRDFYKKKEDAKNKKAEEIKQRKEKRKFEIEKRSTKKKSNMNQVNKSRQMKKKIDSGGTSFKIKQTPKKRVQCDTCKEDLISDAEEEDEMNIGCDKCNLWFHMKCTEFFGIPYEEASKKEYICYMCC